MIQLDVLLVEELKKNKIEDNFRLLLSCKFTYSFFIFIFGGLYLYMNREGLVTNKEIKQNKNFMYRNLRRSNCYGTDFTGSNFNFTSFRGAHFKSCNFFGCTFKGSEFIGTNFKKSKFRRAVFEDVIFEGVNLSGTDFRDAEFKHVIFINTDIDSAKNLYIKDEEVKIFNDFPDIDISKELESAIKLAMTNEYIRESRVLDNKDGDINTITVMVLLEKFSEKILISGLKQLSEKIDREFWTISYIVKAIMKYQEQGIL